jgi:hypothetical protein
MIDDPKEPLESADNEMYNLAYTYDYLDQAIMNLKFAYRGELNSAINNKTERTPETFRLSHIIDQLKVYQEETKKKHDAEIKRITKGL